MRRLLPILLLAALASPATAQYWGERVLEKSFEASDIFFSPGYLNPYGIAGFGGSAPGLIDDPLLNVRVNPAILASDTAAHRYGYLDFRNSREIEQRGFGYADYALRGNIGYIFYPSYYVRSRTVPEPVFSGAAFLRPFGERLPITLGATYQLLFQDERYYSIPQDIYRSQVGASYAGDRTMSGESIPIVDRFSGSDAMHVRGHFASVYGAYRFSRSIDAGLRVGRTLFDREGSFGSRNLWSGYNQSNTKSLWEKHEQRSQNYGHWDLAGGLNIRFTEEASGGLVAGFLTGRADQALARQDTSFHAREQTSSDYFSRYERSGRSDQHWDHDGRSFYGGANFAAALSPAATLTAFYRLTREDVDISLASTIADTSFGTYRYVSSNHNSESLSYHVLRDDRTGTGTRQSLSHRFSTTVQWQLNTRTRLHTGAVFQAQRRQTETVEQVSAFRHRFHRSHYENPPNQQTSVYEDRVREEKELRWDFETRVNSFSIPIYLTSRLSSSVELLFGLNRRMVGWRISDVTLAVFEFREKLEHGQVSRNEHFGERYTQPKEIVTDIQTTVLAGVTVSPDPRFDVRLLVVPQFGETYGGTTLREFQWWIGFVAR